MAGKSRKRTNAANVGKGGSHCKIDSHNKGANGSKGAQHGVPVKTSEGDQGQTRTPLIEEIRPPMTRLQMREFMLRDMQWVSFMVFLFVFAVYVNTCFPSVTGGDSGELIVTACNLGTAHPPGYPLYSMLGHMALQLPWGTPAWRIGVMNSMLGAGCAGMLHATATDITCSVWPGVMAAIGFALSDTVWLYSIQGEVFALNNFLCATMLYLTVRFFRALEQPVAKGALPVGVDAERFAVLGAVVCGLAMANQHTTVFYVGPNVLFVCLALFLHKRVTARLCFQLVIALLLGLSAYAYLPVSAHYKREDSWGDQRTLGGFFHHFLRREYGTFQLAADGTTEDPGMGPRLLLYFSILLEESLFVTPPLALVGTLAMMRTFNLEKRSFPHLSAMSISNSETQCCGFRLNDLSWTGLVYVSQYCLYTGMFHYLANLSLDPLFLGVQARFWMQSNLLVYLWAAVGTRFLVTIAVSLARLTPLTSHIIRERVLLMICVCYAIAQLNSNYHTHDNSANHVFDNHGRATMEAMPPNSLVLLNGDINNNLPKYLQQCEGVRPDLRLVGLQQMTWSWFVPMQAEHYPNVTFPGTKFHPRVPGAFSFKMFLDANYKAFKHRIFICGPFKQGDNTHVGHYKDLPFGHCAKLVKNKHATPKSWGKYLAAGYKGIANTAALGGWKAERYTADTWEKVVFHDTWQRMLFFHSYTSFASNQHPTDLKLLRLAKRITDDVFNSTVEPLLVEKSLMGEDPYRAGGIIYGQWSKSVMGKPEKQDERRRVENEMLRLWARFCELKPDNKELEPFVTKKWNPYTAEAMFL